MKKSVIISLLFFAMGSLYGQQQSDSISIEKGLGTIFRQNGKILNPRAMLQIMQNNQEAFTEMKTARSNYVIGNIIGGIGGFCVGYPLGTAMAGGKANWTMAAIGGGLVLVSIPFSITYTRHAKHAVSVYNMGLRQTSGNLLDLKLGFTSNGFGLNISF